MSCPNCKAFHHLCKSGCCGYVPIDKNLWERSQGKIQTAPKEIIDMGDAVLPMTDTGKCPFLNAELGCSIYDERPEVCRLFGNETHLNLTCSYQRATGEARGFHERKKLDKKQAESMKKFKQKHGKK